MDKINLDELVEQHLGIALDTPSGRSATTIFGGHSHHLRQTLIALRSGERLHDHANPGEATLQILKGHVTLSSGEDGIELHAGDYIIIPPAVHAVTVHSDAALLLTVSVRMPQNP